MPYTGRRPGISIHAPVKGATDDERDGDDPCRDFNPRSRKGSDTKDGDTSFGNTPISIHAPVKGATQESRHVVPDICISIHAPVKGATCK